MRHHEIESWTLSIVDRVKKGQQIEDSRVELKADWIDHQKAARRIAGHANAAGGAPILWLIGVDEKRGVTGAKQQDLATWLAQVQSHFDGLAPYTVDLSVPVDGQTVVALLFETLRAPFVVSNPVHGKTGGGPVEREVPWREGTSVRSARRQDLIRLLSPLQELPGFEVFSGSLEVGHMVGNPPGESVFQWQLHLELYAEVTNETLITIPFHRCQVLLDVTRGVQEVELQEIRLRDPGLQGAHRTSWRTLSLTIQGTPDELLITGPGKIHLSATGSSSPMRIDAVADARVRVLLSAVGIDRAIPIDIALPPCPPDEGDAYRWCL